LKVHAFKFAKSLTYYNNNKDHYIHEWTITFLHFKALNSLYSSLNIIVGYQGEATFKVIGLVIQAHASHLLDDAIMPHDDAHEKDTPLS